jgi:hypothetical protein
MKRETTINKAKTLKRILKNKNKFFELNRKFAEVCGKSDFERMNEIVRIIDDLYDQTWKLAKSVGINDFQHFMDK